MGASSDTLVSESRLLAYVEALGRSLGHADRVTPFRSYCSSNTMLAGRFAAIRVRPAPSRLQPPGPATRGVAPDRVAPRGTGTHQILAVHLSTHHHPPGPRRSGQATLAHRARLSGPQTGAWPRPLRGTRMARLPPSRDAVHRSLWIPCRRARRFPPSDGFWLSSLKAPALPHDYRPRGAPIRPERHATTSMTTLARALARTLPRCPCCQRQINRSKRMTQ